MRSYPAIEKAEQAFYARRIRLCSTSKNLLPFTKNEVRICTGSLIDHGEHETNASENFRCFCTEWDQDFNLLLNDMHAIEQLTAQDYQLLQMGNRDKDPVSKKKFASKYAPRVRSKYVCPRKRNRSSITFKIEKKSDNKLLPLHSNSDSEVVYNAASFIQRSWRQRCDNLKKAEQILQKGKCAMKYRAWQQWNQHVIAHKHFRKKCETSLCGVITDAKIRERAPDHVYLDGKYGMAKWYHNMLSKRKIWRSWLKQNSSKRAAGRI
ncbi:hypothetical protein ABG067_006622 [Albugo candida]